MKKGFKIFKDGTQGRVAENELDYIIEMLQLESKKICEATVVEAELQKREITSSLVKEKIKEWLT